MKRKKKALTAIEKLKIKNRDLREHSEYLERQRQHDSIIMQSTKESFESSIEKLQLIVKQEHEINEHLRSELLWFKDTLRDSILDVEKVKALIGINQDVMGNTERAIRSHFNY